MQDRGWKAGLEVAAKARAAARTIVAASAIVDDMIEAVGGRIDPSLLPGLHQEAWLTAEAALPDLTRLTRLAWEFTSTPLEQVTRTTEQSWGAARVALDKLRPGGLGLDPSAEDPPEVLIPGRSPLDPSAQPR